jgi:ABC-2 type transport system ATP-binding protein
MQHAERLCDRLLLLARGRKVFEGTQEEARRALPGRLSLTCRTDPGGLPGVVRASVSEQAGQGWSRYDVVLDEGRDPADLLEFCTAQGFPLRGFEVSTPTLHEVFIHFVGAERETGQ